MRVVFATHAANKSSLQGCEVSNVSIACMYLLYVSLLCRLSAFGPTNAIVDIVHLFVGPCCICNAHVAMSFTVCLSEVLQS